MSEPETRDARPKRQLRITGTMMAFFAMAVFAVILIVGWASSGNDRAPTVKVPATSERLCQLLAQGYTPGMLGYNGMWRTWPESVSGTQRGFEIGEAAMEGRCANLL
ncbi:hypothetical protein [Actinophytocola sp.]|uniref:hypothetical protein n=1 Tax=Actinophytocola sp. TaxID=1872138 RepID=UPI002D5BBEC8|nr:hypothetical protein [Actinophytocola sp.]HYQ64531.1 hypothetical protein [Actinophytocola sp.]